MEGAQKGKKKQQLKTWSVSPEMFPCQLSPDTLSQAKEVPPTPMIAYTQTVQSFVSISLTSLLHVKKHRQAFNEDSRSLIEYEMAVDEFRDRHCPLMSPEKPSSSLGIFLYSEKVPGSEERGGGSQPGLGFALYKLLTCKTFAQSFLEGISMQAVQAAKQAWGAKQLEELDAEERLAFACEKATTSDKITLKLRDAYKVSPPALFPALI